mmetsp:Transcript_53512/g.88900  ORF Transcript_53512/g.88900 Transcript_53512/m.88900 type:complete len:944 (-) Transcript_53512:918-3749(-)
MHEFCFSLVFFPLTGDKEVRNVFRFLNIHAKRFGSSTRPRAFFIALSSEASPDDSHPSEKKPPLTISPVFTVSDAPFLFVPLQPQRRKISSVRTFPKKRRKILSVEDRLRAKWEEEGLSSQLSSLPSPPLSLSEPSDISRSLLPRHLSTVASLTPSKSLLTSLAPVPIPLTPLSYYIEETDRSKIMVPVSLKKQIPQKSHRREYRPRLKHHNKNQQLNMKLVAAGKALDLQQLAAVIKTSVSQFDIINVVTASIQLARRAERRIPNYNRTRYEAFDLLSKRLLQLLPTMAPQTIFSFLYSCSQACYRNPKLYHTLALWLVQYMRDSTKPPLTFQNIADLSWAFAKHDVQFQELYEELGNRAVAHGKFDDFNISKLLWALATAGVYQQDVFLVLRQRISGKLSKVSAQSLANLAWAHATASIEDLTFMNALADEARLRIGEFTEQGISMLAWSYGKLGVRNKELFDAIVQYCMSSPTVLAEFNPQGLCNTLSAFVKAGVDPGPFTRAICDAALTKLDSFPPVAISSLLWTLARLKDKNYDFIQAVVDCAVASNNWKKWKPQELCSFVWALGTLSFKDDRVPECIAEQMMARVPEFLPTDLSVVAWAYAVQKWRHHELFCALAEQAVAKMDILTTQSIAFLTWSFARSMVRNESLFSAVAKRLSKVEDLHTWNEQYLSNVIWAFGRLGFDDMRFMKAATQAVRARISELHVQGICSVCIGMSYLRYEDRALTEKLVQETLRRLHLFTPNTLVILGFALTLAGRFELLTFMLDALDEWDSAEGGAELSFEQHRQLSIMLLSLRLEAPHILEYVPQWLPDRVAQAITATEEEQTQMAESSDMHRDVAAILRTLRPGFLEEVSTGVYVLDILYPEEKLVIEVDGPCHYLYYSRRMDGATYTRDKLLTLQGYTVVHLPFFVWNSWRSEEEKRTGLQKLLTDAFKKFGES